jgi:hypothetical protein
MTWWEIVLIYVLPGVGLYALITLLVVGPRLARRPRYRPGQPWSYPPMWWTANPVGARLPPLHDPVVDGAAGRREAGGARGTW